jgi:hypothetical protein
LIKDLGLAVEIKNNSLFPIQVFLKETTTNNGHFFIIEKNDTNYVKYLYETYNNFISCAKNEYLKKSRIKY